MIMAQGSILIFGLLGGFGEGFQKTEIEFLPIFGIIVIVSIFVVLIATFFTHCVFKDNNANSKS